MKIMITGGHVTPALAVIEELRKHKNINLVFVGRRNVGAFDKTLSFEYETISRQNIRFINLSAGRLTRILSLNTLRELARVPAGFWRAWQIVGREKPDKVLTFGGYLALPVAIAAYLRQVPVVTHEQTLIPGLANRLIGRFAQKIFVAFPQAISYFPIQKTVVSGNPLRPAIFKTIKKTLWIVKSRPVIYVLGGALGSHSLNLLIEKNLSRLLMHYTIIHQTGEVKKYQDYERLSELQNEHYFVRKHFYDDEIGEVYALADLVISRSGANTVFEMIALEKPAILIPLPWSAGGEQKAHAQLLADEGAAEIFEQGESPESLLVLIERMIKRLSVYRANFRKLIHYEKKGAAQTIVEFLIDQG